MSVEAGSVTLSANGTTTVIMNGSFTPNVFEFQLGARVGTSETHIIQSDGVQDMTTGLKKARSIYHSNSITATKRSSTYSITHWKSVSGTLTKVVSGYVSAVRAGEFDILVDAFDTDYDLTWKASA